MVQQGNTRNQYLAAIVVNIATIIYGTSVGWVSPSQPILLSEENSPLYPPLRVEVSSWLGGLLCLGGITGTVIYGYLADLWGRKIGGYLLAVPYMISWACIVFGQSAMLIFTARYFAGIGGGGTLMIIPLFVAEIAEDRIRGSLGSLLVLAINVGIIISYVLGSILSYHTLNYILSVFPIIYLGAFYFLPETPVYLMSKGKSQEAIASLQWYRGISKQVVSSNDCFDKELEKLKCSANDNVSENKTVNKVTIRDFMTKAALRGLMIGVTLMAIQQFTGLFAVLSYAATIFEQSGSTISPNLSAIILGTLQLCGSYTSTLFVERAGRKLLLILSATGTGLCLFTLGTFTFLKLLGYDVTSFGWIPVGALSTAVFVSSCGLGPLPFVVVAEIFSEKIRGIAALICMFLLWFFAFLIVQFFQSMVEVFGMHGCFCFFGCCMVAAVIFIWVCIPETKGRSLDNILQELGGEKNKKIAHVIV